MWPGPGGGFGLKMRPNRQASGGEARCASVRRGYRGTLKSCGRRTAAWRVSVSGRPLDTGFATLELLQKRSEGELITGTSRARDVAVAHDVL